jgi:hypothetical protein
LEDGMKSKVLVVVAVAAGLVAGSELALAHHGGVGLYETKVTSMKGTITQFEWINPHNQIHFTVKDDKGNTKEWIVATEPPQVMLERGWTRRSLKPGDEITAYVFVATNGAPVGNLQRIVLANGTEFTTGRAPAPAPEGGAAPRQQ